MKITHNGKRYNTDRVTVVAHRDCYSHSNNYSGTVYIGVAEDGTMLKWADTNGQDCWFTNYVEVIERPDSDILDDYDMDDDEEEDAKELGLITEV